MSSYDLTKPLFILSTSSSTFLAGAIIGFSAYSIPTIKATAPNASSATLSWRFLFERGKAMMPPMAGLSMLSSFGCAYTHYHRQVTERAYTFIAAGLLPIAIVPFTFVFMEQTSARLMQFSDVVEEKESEKIQMGEVQRLLSTWSSFNLVRGVLAFAGTLTAFQAL